MYIFGHKSPDTDSVISAIIYSNFLKSKKIGAKAVILDNINKETKFVLKKFKIEIPEKINKIPAQSKIILVDHNDKKQSISNFDELKIDLIIDHHKFNLQTSEPVNIIAKTLGSTCSILYEILKKENYKISKKEAGLLISGIISDTLFFRSPTSTDRDKAIVEKLNKIAEIKDLKDYANQMFEEKSNLDDFNAKEIIKLDYKEFEFNRKKYGIGVIETTNKSSVMKRKTEILQALEEIKKEEKLQGLLLSIIDILNEHNTTIITDEHEAEILRAVFSGEQVEHNVYSLGPIISRKKQIIPKLEQHFNSKN